MPKLVGYFTGRTNGSHAKVFFNFLINYLQLYKYIQQIQTYMDLRHTTLGIGFYLEYRDS
jgi:hypothetical protein